MLPEVMAGLRTIIAKQNPDSDQYQCILRHPKTFKGLLQVLSTQVDTTIEVNVKILIDCLWVIQSLTFEPKVTCLLVELGMPQILSAFYLQHFIMDVADDFYEPGHMMPVSKRLSPLKKDLLVELLWFTANVAADHDSKKKVDYLSSEGLHRTILLVFKCYRDHLDWECL